MAKTATKLAVFDIDGTIFRSSLFLEIVDVLLERGDLPRDMQLGYIQAHRDWLDRLGSYDDYLDRVVESFMQGVKGLPASKVEAAAEHVVANLSKRTYRYTRDLIESLRPNFYLIAISGSPLELVERFCRIYGFDAFHATKYEVSEGRYTGHAAVGHLAKDKVVKKLAKDAGIGFGGSIGVGDTDKDIAFLELVERPIAFNPSSGLFTEAIRRGWQIIAERKDVIYYYNTSHDSTQPPTRPTPIPEGTVE